MTLVWGAYFSVAELLSLLPSQSSACILISEEAQAENYSGDYACASMHEAIFRFARFIWGEAGHDNIVAFGTIMIAAFTYVLYRSTDRLWDAGERQLAHIRESSERQLRAYVGIEYCEVITRDGGSTFTVEVRIKNTGATPARDLHHHIAADIFTSFGERIEFAPPGRNMGVIPLAPGMSYVLETPIAIGGPTGVPGIDTLRRAIFTWGRVNYWDVFGNEQHMMFRFRSGEPIRKHNGTVMQTVGWRMTAEDQGNSAT